MAIVQLFLFAKEKSCLVKAPKISPCVHSLREECNDEEKGCIGNSDLEEIARERVQHIKKHFEQYIDGQKEIKDKLDQLKMKVRDLEVNIEVGSSCFRF